MLTEKTLSEISNSYETVLKYPDTYRFPLLLKGRLQFFRVVFNAANKHDFYYRLGARNVVTLPWGCDPELHRMMDEPKRYPIGFCGTFYPNRYKFLKMLKEYREKTWIFGKYWVLRPGRILPAYSSKFSKKKYKQYQLFVVLLCKVWRNVSYKDIIEIMSSNLAFIGVLSLSEIPHFTTTQKFSERIDKALVAFVFNRTLKFFAGSLGSSMMVDSTGYSVNYHSYYYDRRLGDFGGKVKRRCVKTTICVDDKSQLIVLYSARFGCVYDSRKFRKVLESIDGEIVDRFRIRVGDKGYDSAKNHIVAKRYRLFGIMPARNEGVPIRRTKGEKQGEDEEAPARRILQ